MKYKVGDKVRVRKDLIGGKSYGNWAFIHEMAPLIGKYVTVTKVLEDSYNIDEDICYITDEMLEDVEEYKKEDVKFEAGKWYKYHDWYLKFERVTDENIFIASEYIDQYRLHQNNLVNFTCGEADFQKELLTDLSEIQQYLPEGHPDKINTLEQSIESLLEEAKRRYPIGTLVKTLKGKTVTCSCAIYPNDLEYLYREGTWAEIVESPKVSEEIRPDLSVKLIPPIQSLLLRDGMYVVGVDPIDLESSKNKGESNSSTSESDFPIISTKRIINFSQLT